MKANFSRVLSSRSRAVTPFSIGVAALLRQRLASADDDVLRQERSSADGFATMLSFIPANFSGFSEDDSSVNFADIAAQLATAELESPDSLEGDDEAVRLWINAVYPLAIATPFGSNALRLTRALIGLDITDIDQTVEFGTPPASVTIVRGRFVHAAVEAAWDANGYKRLDVAGISVASLFEDAQIDMQSELGRIVLARMNNVAFIAEDTLAYASTLPLLTEILDTAAGTKASLTQRVDIAALLQAAELNLASAILFSGASLSISSMVSPDLITEPDAFEMLLASLTEPAMPPVASGLIGMTPGGPTILPSGAEPPVLDLPPATLVLQLLMLSPGTADAAVETVDARLRTLSSTVSQQPYANLFASWELQSSDDGSVLTILLTLVEDTSIGIWSRMLFARDLLFLAW